MEGYALSALIGAVFAGAGAWLTFGRRTLTKEEHSAYCVMAQKPVKKDIEFVKDGQKRLEGKMDTISVKVDETLKVLYKMNGVKN